LLPLFLRRWLFPFARDGPFIQRRFENLLHCSRDGRLVQLHPRQPLVVLVLGRVVAHGRGRLLSLDGARPDNVGLDRDSPRFITELQRRRF
jgi:hypothetical protein